MTSSVLLGALNVHLTVFFAVASKPCLLTYCCILRQGSLFYTCFVVQLWMYSNLLARALLKFEVPTQLVLTYSTKFKFLLLGISDNVYSLTRHTKSCQSKQFTLSEVTSGGCWWEFRSERGRAEMPSSNWRITYYVASENLYLLLHVSTSYFESLFSKWVSCFFRNILFEFCIHFVALSGVEMERLWVSVRNGWKLHCSMHLLMGKCIKIVGFLMSLTCVSRKLDNNDFVTRQSVAKCAFIVLPRTVSILLLLSWCVDTQFFFWLVWFSRCGKPYPM